MDTPLNRYWRGNERALIVVEPVNYSWHDDRKCCLMLPNRPGSRSYNSLSYLRLCGHPRQLGEERDGMLSTYELTEEMAHVMDILAPRSGYNVVGPHADGLEICQCLSEGLLPLHPTLGRPSRLFRWQTEPEYQTTLGRSGTKISTFGPNSYVQIDDHRRPEPSHV